MLKTDKSPYARPNGRRPVPERPGDLSAPGGLGVDPAARHVILEHIKIFFAFRPTVDIRGRTI